MCLNTRKDFWIAYTAPHRLHTSRYSVSMLKIDYIYLWNNKNDTQHPRTKRLWFLMNSFKHPADTPQITLFYRSNHVILFIYTRTEGWWTFIKLERNISCFMTTQSNTLSPLKSFTKTIQAKSRCHIKKDSQRNIAHNIFFSCWNVKTF